MPTLFRFLVICAVIGGSIYGAMWALVLFVDPQPREVTIRIPPERINPPVTGSLKWTSNDTVVLVGSMTPLWLIVTVGGTVSTTVSV